MVVIARRASGRSDPDALLYFLAVQDQKGHLGRTEMACDLGGAEGS